MESIHANCATQRIYRSIKARWKGDVDPVWWPASAFSKQRNRTEQCTRTRQETHNGSHRKLLVGIANQSSNSTIRQRGDIMRCKTRHVRRSPKFSVGAALKRRPVQVTTKSVQTTPEKQRNKAMLLKCALETAISPAVTTKTHLRKDRVKISSYRLRWGSLWTTSRTENRKPQ